MQEFHAFQVVPNKEHSLEIPEGCGFHLSIVALPHTVSGRTTLYVSVDGKSLAVGTLDSQRNLLQISTDLIFNYEQKVCFHAKGSATVHCIGYRQQLDMDDEVPFGLDDSDDDGRAAAPLPIEAAEMSMEEDEEDSDVAEDPTQLPSDGDEEIDDDEEEGDDDEEDDDDEEIDDDDEEDDEDEEEPPTKVMMSESRKPKQVGRRFK